MESVSSSAFQESQSTLAPKPELSLLSKVLGLCFPASFLIYRNWRDDADAIGATNSRLAAYSSTARRDWTRARTTRDTVAYRYERNYMRTYMLGLGEYCVYQMVSGYENGVALRVLAEEAV